ncbi:MAG: hypothetical protein IPJ67_00380 [Candidatus Moraniibacteriota bacterium]|nr:MAG: hypothetical protein IPJ67_00380 [Candidatus Moranbacteria bacterium]
MKWALVLWGLVLSTILSALAWGAVLFFVSPENATGFEWALFLLSLLLVLTGTCSLGILLLRRMLFGIDWALMRVGTSVRQGLFLAIFFVGALLLVRAGWFVWWDAMLLFGFLFLVDLFFLRKFRVKKSE